MGFERGPLGRRVSGEYLVELGSVERVVFNGQRVGLKLTGRLHQAATAWGEALGLVGLQGVDDPKNIRRARLARLRQHARQKRLDGRGKFAPRRALGERGRGLLKMRLKKLEVVGMLKRSVAGEHKIKGRAQAINIASRVDGFDL